MCNNNVKAIMKKIYSFLFAATALFAAVSCQKEVAPEVEAPKGEKITFTASTEVETKTALHENGKSTIWEDGDQISVFDANKEGNNRCFAIDDLSEDAKTATFSYEGEFVKDQSGMADPTVVALYPYQEKAYCDFFYYNRNYITGLNFPAEQTAVAGSFDSKAAFALGLGTMNEKVLGFQNLYALLKFTVRDAGVKKVTVRVNEGAYIAGDAKIQMVLNTDLIGNEEGKPVFESPVLSIVENGSNTITLTCEDGFDTEATYYVAVVPTEFTSISLYCDDVLVNHKDATMTLVANKIYNLKDNGSPKKESEIAFEKTTYEAVLGVGFVAPELKGATGVVEYSSSDDTIASVNPKTGAVTLHNVGKVTITAKVSESRYELAGEASYELSIGKFNRELRFSESSVSVRLNFDVFYAPTLSGMKLDDAVITYESSDPTVATVDERGYVTLNKTGSTKITASTEETDTFWGSSASYTIQVDPMPAFRGLGFSESSITVIYGEDFTEPELIGAAPGEATYGSSDTTVATVDPLTGKVNIVGAGTTEITATTPGSYAYMSESASYTLTVNPSTVRLYVESEKTSIPMNIYAWKSDKTELLGTWPGKSLTWDSDVQKYYYDFPADIKGSELNFIVNVDGYQTADLKITIDEYTETYAINWKWVYLKVNSNWKQSSAWFAGRFWTNNSSDYWCKLISVPNQTDTWGCVIPNNHTMVIFTRMNSADKNNMNWNNVWNQTNDLTIPTNGDNLYTIGSGAWSKGSGTWSTLTF